MNSKQLLAMASRRQWIEVSTLLSRPENHGLASELMPQLEELGDRAAASRSWTDGANHYQEAADKLPARQRDLVKWFCERAVSRFKKAESAADIERLQLRLAPPPPQFRKPVLPRPPAPPPIDLEALVRQLTDLARDRRRGA